MKRAAAFFALILGLTLVSCGGGAGTAHPSRVKVRAFVTNTFLGALDVIDLQRDLLGARIPPSANSFLAASPTFTALSDDKKVIIVFDSATNAIAVVNNTNENIDGSITLPNWTESIAISGDNKTVWAAIRNAQQGDQPSPGAVAVVDLTKGSVSSQIPIPLARYVVRNHGGTKLVTFADQSNSAYVIDLANQNAVTIVPGFDRPVAAVFSADDSKAYVLSCGPECGGTAASVRVLDMTTNTPGTTVAVPGATVGLLNGNSLYVAGSVPAGSPTPGGFLSVIAADSMALVNSSPIQIGDGHHANMALSGNGKLYIGARTCTNLEGVPNSGCLSIFDTTAGSATVPNPNCTDRNAPALTCGDVTGMTPIAGRDVMYIIQGGELVIYDTTTGALQKLQIDLVGKVYDVKQIDELP